MVKDTEARDVRAAVLFAAERGLPVAVQLTGHGPALAGEGGVLINTSRLTGVRINAEARTAWIEAGVRYSQLSPLQCSR